MTSATTTLLLTGTLLLGAVAVASCVALVIHHAVSEALRARRERRADAALELLVGSIVGGEDLDSVAAVAVKRFGRDAVGEVLRRARNDIAGERAVSITAALEAIGEVEKPAPPRPLAERRAAPHRHPPPRRVRRGRCARRAARSARRLRVGGAARGARRPAGRRPRRDDPPRRRFLPRGGHREPRLAALVLRALRAGRAGATLRAPADGHPEPGRGEARDRGSRTRARRRSQSRRSVRGSPHADPELRASAARFAGKLWIDDSAPGLVSLLARSRVVRPRGGGTRARGAAQATRARCSRSAACLTDPSWWVRANAARALSARRRARASRSCARRSTARTPTPATPRARHSPRCGRRPDRDRRRRRAGRGRSLERWPGADDRRAPGRRRVRRPRVLPDPELAPTSCSRWCRSTTCAATASASGAATCARCCPTRRTSRSRSSCRRTTSAGP